MIEGSAPTSCEWRLKHDDAPLWFVAYTKPRQEGTAQVNAERQGYLTYLPLYRINKRGVSSDDHNEPMFPRYLFIRPAYAGQSLAPLRSTRGVHCLLAFGDRLATLPDDRLQAIRRYENQRNEAEPYTLSAIQPGRRVRLTDSGLQGLEGLVQSVSAKRVVVLMTLLGQNQSIKVAHEQLELA